MDERIRAVNRMQDYILAHLEEEITLADLAKASLYSPWYSYRLFRDYTGLTPSAYIRRLRLSRSALRLKKRETDVTGAAFALGFGSVDGYQRAFFREFGRNPGEYARSPAPIPLFVPYAVHESRKETTEMKETQTVFVQIVQKPARRVILKRGVRADHYFDYCEEVGCDIWGLLLSMDSLCGEPVCLWLPDQYRKPGTSKYVQGVEVPAEGEITVPEGFDVIDLPPAEYLSFQGEPFEEENFEDAIRQVQKAMRTCDPARFGYVWDESQPRVQLEPRCERGYVELCAVKKIG